MAQADPGFDVAAAIEAVSRVTYGFMYTQMLCVTVKLGIPDLLSGGPKGAEELARASGSNERALYRVLRALCDTGLLAEDRQHRFSLTAASQPLRSDVPFSVRAMVLAYGGAPWWHAWGNLVEAVRTGTGCPSGSMTGSIPTTALSFVNT
jgi:hypothetical protein